MFLFIHLRLWHLILSKNLNTSHVLIYRRSLEQKETEGRNLNTSHVLIYPVPLALLIPCNIIFKYISCSYLSVAELCPLQVFPHLNTSHVLIYPFSESSYRSACFHLNTSHVLIYQEAVAHNAFVDLFKYISCSYLSYFIKCNIKKFPDLNTSHVLIYLIPVIITSAIFFI